MEILAQKKRGLIPLYSFCAIIVTAVFASMFITYLHSAMPAIILALTLIGGVTGDVMCIVICVWVIRTPAQITYENGKVDFGNGYVAPAENIAKVEYRQARARGWHYQWGKLTVYVDDQVFVYRYIADVEEAHNRIINVMLEAKKGK